MVKDAVSAALKNAMRVKDYSASIEIKYDRELTHGDLVSTVALQVAHSKRKNAMEIAEELVGALKLPPEVETVSVARPGFINFKLSHKYLGDTLGESPKPQKHALPTSHVLVEYSSPNIAKPFSVGHLRSTIIGDAVANMYEFLGYKVTRVNHLGDWGTQFGKLIYAYENWGDDKKLAEAPIDEMLKLYVKFHEVAEVDSQLDNRARECFKRLSCGDKKAVAIWEKMVRWSLKEFHRIYRILGVKFDKELGESFYHPMEGEIVESAKKRGLAKESEGAIIISLEADGMPPALLVKSDGTGLYFTRDMAALRYRLEKMKADTVIYHTGDEQALHFRQLFAIAHKMGWDKGKTLIHAAHGLVRLPEGKMSTRRGKIIKLDDLIEEAIGRAYAIVDTKNRNLTKAQKERVARVVGLGAVKYNDLMNHRRTAIIFDWDKMLSLTGNSAPYLQYTYTRLHAIASKTKLKPAYGSWRDEDEDILRRMAQFEDVVAEAAHNQAPNLLAKYLFDFANICSAYYEKYPVLKAGDDTVVKHRLAVISQCAKVLKTGLGLLGIETLSEI